MPPIILPKVITGVFYMVLGLSGYWLFGMSRVRGWILIAIIVLTLALFLYGVRMTLAWVNERKEALRELLPAETLKSKPWLRVPAWRCREIVCGNPVGNIYLLLACLFFGGPALLFLWAVIMNPSARLGESLIWAANGCILGFIVIGLFYWRLRYRRYGQSVCRLLTLPGRVGGWLKADVDCTLPAGADNTVTVRLKNMVPNGRSARELWRMEQRISVPARGERTVIPVRLQIPRSTNQRFLSSNASALERAFAPLWALEIEKKVPGIDFLAQFGVPVYDVPELPEMSPPASPNPGAPVSDPVGRWSAALILIAGAASFFAITHQASRTGWLATSLMSPGTEWMSHTRFDRELYVWSLSHYPLAIEGRCAGVAEEYRSEWRIIPPQTQFAALHAMPGSLYERKNREYSTQGYDLESTTHFTDCTGVTKYQATWLKKK